MIIQESPNRWSCVPAAFATATRIPFDTLIEAIGHDGSEIMFPTLPEPKCRRSFVGDEMTYALYDLGWLSIPFESQVVGYQQEDAFFTLTVDDKLEKVMQNSIGVIVGEVKTTGHRHAAAWDGRICYDPTGFIYPLDRFDVHTFYLLEKKSCKS